MLYNKNYTTVKSKTLPLHPAIGMSFPKILLRKRKQRHIYEHVPTCMHTYTYTSVYKVQNPQNVKHEKSRQ